LSNSALLRFPSTPHRVSSQSVQKHHERWNLYVPSSPHPRRDVPKASLNDSEHYRPHPQTRWQGLFSVLLQLSCWNNCEVGIDWHLMITTNKAVSAQEFVRAWASEHDQVGKCEAHLLPTIDHKIAVTAMDSQDRLELSGEKTDQPISKAEREQITKWLSGKLL
jgi:hypothetical protein